MASADVMMTIGSTNAAIVMPAAITFLPSVEPPKTDAVHQGDEHRKAE